MITAYGTVENAVNAIQGGAVNFVQKPWQNEKLLADVSAAIGRRRAEDVEIVAGDELRHDGRRCILRTRATRNDGPETVAGLHRGEIAKFRNVLAKALVLIGGKKAVVGVVGHAAIYAANVCVAEADEGLRVGDGRLFNRNAWTSEKIAALAPMPSASVSIATAAKPGVLRSWRSA